MPLKNLLITIPHSGEQIPGLAPWLTALSREVLLLDVDRFVDRLYAPALKQLGLSAVIAQVHRYAVDLNRSPEDIDSGTVDSAPQPPGTHSKGFHWSVSTQGHVILKSPISRSSHEALVREYHDPFHREISQKLQAMDGSREIFHLDCHSMPGTGTAAHADQGAKRPDVVLSDFDGKSSRQDFLKTLTEAFQQEGFSVSVNWPYKGGRITQRYGKPEKGHHTIQIELNRSLYMSETTREILEPGFSRLQKVLVSVLSRAVAFTESSVPPRKQG